MFFNRECSLQRLKFQLGQARLPHPIQYFSTFSYSTVLNILEKLPTHFNLYAYICRPLALFQMFDFFFYLFSSEYKHQENYNRDSDVKGKNSHDIKVKENSKTKIEYTMQY